VGAVHDASGGYALPMALLALAFAGAAVVLWLSTRAPGPARPRP
jgi:cyanate permease